MLLQTVFMLRPNQIIQPKANGKPDGNHRDTLQNRSLKIIQRRLADNNNGYQQQLHALFYIEPHTDHNGNNSAKPDGQIGPFKIIGHNNSQAAAEHRCNNLIFYGVHRAF